MKKLLSLSILLWSTALLLSSCTVNWFDKQYDVPWWVIAIPIALVAVVLLVAARRAFANKTYICPKCSQKFTPKWWVVTFTVHVGSDRIFKCPHCGARGFCRLVREPKD